MVGLVHNQPAATPLKEMVAKSQAINVEMDQGHFQAALELRGRSFLDSFEMFKTLARAEPKQALAGKGRILLLTGGPDAPGMNAILRTALRMARNVGQDVVGARYGFGGLARGDIWDLNWMTVHGWINRGGSELGAVRHDLTEEEIAQMAEQIKQWDIRGMIAVGGLSTYLQAQKIMAAREQYRSLRIPMMLVPRPSTTTCRAPKLPSARTLHSTTSSMRSTRSSIRRAPRTGPSS
jgi:6-phosphofructokinase 1